MKTQHLFDEYNQLLRENRAIITDLEQSIKDMTGKLGNLNKQYEEHIKNGDDDKADTLFSEIVKTETDIQMTKKKLDTKRPILRTKGIDSAIEVCTHLKELPGLYKDDVEKLKGEYIEAKKRLNEIEMKIKALNRDYDNEYQDFVDLFDTYYEHAELKEKFLDRALEKGIIQYRNRGDFTNPTSKLILNINKINEEIGGRI